MDLQADTSYVLLVLYFLFAYIVLLALFPSSSRQDVFVASLLKSVVLVCCPFEERVLRRAIIADVQSRVGRSPEFPHLGLFFFSFLLLSSLSSVSVLPLIGCACFVTAESS